MAGSSMTDYPAPLTSQLSPDPALLPSTTSAGSSLSSQRMQLSSWSKYWSSLAWTLLQLTLGWTSSLCDYNVAARLVFSLPKFSRDPPAPWVPLASCCGPHPIQDNGAGLQGHQRNYNRLPQLHPTAVLHQLSGWYCHCWKQTRVAKWSHNCSLFWHLTGVTNSQPMLWQQNNSPSSDSRLTCSDFTLTLHGITTITKITYMHLCVNILTST